MAIKEINSLIRLKDKDGNEYIAYPITKGENTTYDGTTSGLAAEDLQGAIDELATNHKTHEGNKSNPHGVTKTQVGLANVPNVATNDQTPTYTEASTLAKMTSGEKLNVAFGKISKAVTDLISHLANKSNPHAVTKSQVGLANVPNVTTNNQTPTFSAATSDEDIVSGETLSTIFGKLLKSIQTLRTGLSGKAASSHNHAATAITSGTLGLARGGTGQTSLASVKSAFGITALETAMESLVSDETIAAAEAAGIDLTTE
ncbi:hypothetical protein LI177_05215 [bacterium 210820-DFI.6.37]|nr:hypothetical protein [bacterium 210820-DFI.6.37]